MVTAPLATGLLAGRITGCLNSAERASSCGSSSNLLGGQMEWHRSIGCMLVTLWPHLLRCLAYFQAQADFRIRAMHVPGHLNAGTDGLSRNRAADFQAPFPSASPTATQVPQGLMDLLLHGPLEWVFQNWRSRFSASWRPA